MGRWARVTLAAAVGLSVALCAGTGAVGLALPAELSLRAEAEVHKPPPEVFDRLDDVDGVRAWWTDAMAAFGDGPAMEIVHLDGSPTAGPGTRIAFRAGDFTAETWEIVDLDPPRRAEYTVDFAGMMTVRRTLELAPDGAGGTRVVWSETASLPNPWLRLLAVASGGSEGAEANFRAAMASL